MDVWPTESIHNPPTTQHLMLDKLSGHTSQHRAVFGTPADVFYELPLWEKIQLIQVMAYELLETFFLKTFFTLQAAVAF